MKQKELNNIIWVVFVLGIVGSIAPVLELFNNEKELPYYFILPTFLSSTISLCSILWMLKLKTIPGYYIFCANRVLFIIIAFSIGFPFDTSKILASSIMSIIGVSLLLLIKKDGMSGFSALKENYRYYLDMKKQSRINSNPIISKKQNSDINPMIKLGSILTLQDCIVVINKENPDGTYNIQIINDKQTVDIPESLTVQQLQEYGFELKQDIIIPEQGQEVIYQGVEGIVQGFTSEGLPIVQFQKSIVIDDKVLVVSPIPSYMLSLKPIL